jgi:hypothetical protein
VLGHACLESAANSPFAEEITVKIKSQRDFWSGLMFIGVGLAFAWGATNYSFGSSARPGPGYFPFGLGILMALRATDELELHFPIALANGCTMEELEEVIYQATAYAGFPAANAARAAATKSFRKQGLID